jgi:hypothetical protein
MDCLGPDANALPNIGVLIRQPALAIQVMLELQKFDGRYRSVPIRQECDIVELLDADAQGRLIISLERKQECVPALVEVAQR